MTSSGHVEDRPAREERSIVREVEAEVDANLKRAQSLRQAILAKAFGRANEAVRSLA